MNLKSSIKKGIACFTTIFMVTCPLYAKTTSSLPTLTLEKCVEMGINMDTVLPEYTRKIELYTAKKGDYQNLASLEYQQAKTYIEQYETAKTYRKDVIYSTVLDSYQNLILLQEKINLGVKQIELQEKLLNQYSIKFKNGLCDKLTYENQVQELSNLKEEQEKNIKSFENLKASFLKLTNIDVNSYTLVPDYSYEEFDLKESISAYSSRIATELTKYQKNLAELSDTYFWDSIFTSGVGGSNPNYSTYIEGKINVADALAKVDTSYKNYKLSIENLYTTASNSLIDVNLKKAAYQTAQDNLKPLKLKYDTGYISEADYEQQTMACEQARLAYLSSIYNYNVNSYIIMHPWAYSAFSY